MAIPPAPPLSPTPASTLLIRHLPEGLPPHTLQRLFQHYGASQFRLCHPGRLKNCAFVDFDNEDVAARAQSQLHRLRFLGKILTVESAKPAPQKDETIQEESKKTIADEGHEVAPPLPAAAPPLPDSHETSQRSAVLGREPIAPALGVDYPFPPHLEYAYPPPDGNILTNIVNTLIAVPRFYTQVLHLMNKMNLPAPFRPALPTPPLPPPVPFPAAGKRQAGDLSSGESELESSDEEGVIALAGEDKVDGAETELDSHQGRRKRVKSGAVVGPAVDKDASHEAAGVKAINIGPKPLIKKNKPIMQIRITPKLSGSEGASKDIGGQEGLHDSKDEVDPPKRATRAALEAGQVPVAEILSLPMFKNYSAGTPTQVLYIKNLGKEVAPEDLFYVYGAFFASLEEAKIRLNVKLMQEGRMRGQAFVTFPTIESAQDALGLTHGFVLKGKPMVVQYGRNPSAPKTAVAT